MTPFITLEDAMGRRTDALTAPDCCLVVMLSAGVPKQVAVPQGATVMLASCTGPFWVRYGGPAALPTADILEGTAPELNPPPAASPASPAWGWSPRPTAS